jgi:hypothetical protein
MLARRVQAARRKSGAYCIRGLGLAVFASVEKVTRRLIEENAVEPTVSSHDELV